MLFCSVSVHFDFTAMWTVCLNQLVTAFAVSATASNWDRIGKPFNPLLGETYQLDRYTHCLCVVFNSLMFTFNTECQCDY